jgi:hypothetical protein
MADAANSAGETVGGADMAVAKICSSTFDMNPDWYRRDEGCILV